MPETLSDRCFDRIIPAEFNDIARREKAIAENPANASPFKAATVRSKLWKPGRTLRISFLDGEPNVQYKVATYAKTWMKFAKGSAS